MWSREDASRESAKQVMIVITKISEDLIRLQEQQRVDEAIAERFRKEIDEISNRLRTLEGNQSDVLSEVKHFLSRIQYLETTLSAELGEKFVTRGDFDDYLLELDKQYLASSTANAERIKRLVLNGG